MTKPVFVTCAERLEMQSMRDAGLSVTRVALAFDRSRPTVLKRTVTPPRKTTAKRNEYLARISRYRPLDEREAIARRFGLASAKSLEVTLAAHRRRQRTQGEARP